jgi:hypothetical protein
MRIDDPDELDTRVEVGQRLVVDFADRVVGRDDLDGQIRGEALEAGPLRRRRQAVAADERDVGSEQGLRLGRQEEPHLGHHETEAITLHDGTETAGALEGRIAVDEACWAHRQWLSTQQLERLVLR